MWNEDLERLGVQKHFPAVRLSREPLLLDLQAPRLDNTGHAAISNFLFRSELPEFEFSNISQTRKSESAGQFARYGARRFPGIATLLPLKSLVVPYTVRSWLRIP